MDDLHFEILGIFRVRYERKDPCRDLEFELHNHIDYARQSQHSKY